MYQVRPGIVLVNICDRYYLVATEKARRYCRYMMRINESAASVWQMIEKKMTFDDIVSLVMNEYETETDIEERMHQLMEDFKDKGYITTGE